MPSREELIAAIQSELAKRKNPARVTTREQALANAEGADGSLESGPWYMDLAKDVLNPVDAAAGVASGGMRAAGQGVRALGRGAVEGALGGASERQGVIDLVNSGKDLAPAAKGMIKETMQGITEKGIKPKDAALRELLTGVKGEVHPDMVAKVFPNYAKKLAEKQAIIDHEIVRSPIAEGHYITDTAPGGQSAFDLASKEVTQGAPIAADRSVAEGAEQMGLPFKGKNYSDTVPHDTLQPTLSGLKEADSVKVNPIPSNAQDVDRVLGYQEALPIDNVVINEIRGGRVPLSGNQLLRLKRGADKAAGYSKSAAPFQEAAASRNADAKRLGDIARTQIYDQAPGSEQLLGDMAKDIKLRKFLGKKSESDPVGLLKSKAGTTKDSMLAAADDVAGTNLRSYGDKIESAVDLQMRPKNLVNPLGVAPELRKMATRGLIKGGAVAQDAAGGLGKLLGAAKAPEALGYAGAREMTEAALPDEQSAPQPAGADRAHLIQKIQDEIKRRSGN